jgi:RHS repeat-associated protein
MMDGEKRIAMMETVTIHPTLTTPMVLYRFQLGDHLGSAVVELTEDGDVINYEEFHPYGSTAWWLWDSATDVSQARYRYTGMERDEETGLQVHGVRYYAPWLGRWTSRDPIGLKAGINRFAYCGGSPTGRSDLSGHADTQPDWDAQSKAHYSYGGYSVDVAPDDSIKVQKGDWLSKYSAAIYHGDTGHNGEFYRQGKDKGLIQIAPEERDHIKEGETIYWKPPSQGVDALFPESQGAPASRPEQATDLRQLASQPWSVEGTSRLLSLTPDGRAALAYIKAHPNVGIYQSGSVPGTDASGNRVELRAWTWDKNGTDTGNVMSAPT